MLFRAYESCPNLVCPYHDACLAVKDYFKVCDSKKGYGMNTIITCTNINKTDNCRFSINGFPFFSTR